MHCPDCKRLVRGEQGLAAHRAVVHVSGRRYPCPKCGRKFATDEAIRQHAFDVHGFRDVELPPRKQRRLNISKSARLAAFDAIAGDDLPDGAYFAMAEEFGLEVEDFL